METIEYGDIMPIIGLAIMGAVLAPAIVTVFKLTIKTIISHV